MDASSKFFFFALISFANSNVCKDAKVHKIENLNRNIKHFQIDCGQVCDTEVAPIRKGKYYDFIEKDVDCQSLFESPILDGSLLETNGKDPPNFCELNNLIRQKFTYNGQLKVRT